jgi:hypothetical protein
MVDPMGRFPRSLGLPRALRVGVFALLRVEDLAHPASRARDSVVMRRDLGVKRRHAEELSAWQGGNPPTRTSPSTGGGPIGADLSRCEKSGRYALEGPSSARSDGMCGPKAQSSAPTQLSTEPSRATKEARGRSTFRRRDRRRVSTGSTRCPPQSRTSARAVDCD